MYNYVVPKFTLISISSTRYKGHALLLKYGLLWYGVTGWFPQLDVALFCVLKYSYFYLC